MPIPYIEVEQLTAEVNEDVAAVQLTVDFTAEPTAESVTITRTDPGGVQFVVRGAELAPLSDGRFVVVDTEAPLGVPVTYFATGYTAGGAFVVTSNSVTVTIEITPGQAWIKDPGHPATAVSPLIISLPSTTRPVRRGVYRAAGARYPVIRSDVRSSESGVMELHTLTLEDAADLDLLLDSGAVLLFQCDPTYGITQFYFSADDVEQIRLDPQSGTDPRRDWNIPYDKVLPPVGGSAGLVTWQDVIDDFDTWQDLIDGKSTWLATVSGT